MSQIRWLEELGREDVDLAGGKGANLGALVQAGFPVPSGFVVLTSAYREFVQANGLQQEIGHIAGQVSLDEPSSAETASEAIYALFERAVMLDSLAQDVIDAYRQVGGVSVAVRSSGTAEDLPDASFAGQQDSFLNVVGPERLLAAVKRCWASLWTARALAYRARKAISPESVSMAVIVQQMVAADASGTLFTINPVSGNCDELLINAAWGLGEAVVSGRVAPDSIVVDRASRQIICKEVGDKKIMAVPVENGTAEAPVELLKRNQEALTADQIAELAELGCAIESHFGCPQDVEWAIANEKVYILQSRPVTGAPVSEPRPMRQEVIDSVPGDDGWDLQDAPPARPYDLWTRTNLGENLPYPVSPLTATTFPALFNQNSPQSGQGGEAEQIVRRFYGRLYVNEGAIMHKLTEEYGLPSGLIDRVWGSRRRGEHKVEARLHPFRLLRKIPSLLKRGMNQPKKRGPKLEPEEFFAQIDQWVGEFLQKDLSLLDDRALWAEGLPVWGKRGGQVFAKNMAIASSAVLTFGILERLVSWFAGRKEIAQDLVTGLSGVYSAEVGPALARMAEMLESAGLANLILEQNPSDGLASLRSEYEAQPVAAELDEFLQRHGHRCPNEVELLNPRWAESPDQVIEMLAAYLGARGKASPAEAESRQRQRREEAVAMVESKIGPLRRRIFRFALARAQRSVRLRDNSRFCVAKFYFPMRKLYADLGQRWTERGWLSEPEDIFFLTLSELEAIVEAGNPAILGRDPKAVVADRRLAYDYWYHIVPPEALGPDRRAVIGPEEGGTFLQGVAASGGRARGIARLVHDPRSAAKLRPGEILVTQATDPGWTPVFPLVSGLVLEIGGQLSHGAIVAREYGVPAVVNVQGAMRRIRDGQTIVVDGTAGRVYLDGEEAQLEG